MNPIPSGLIAILDFIIESGPRSRRRRRRNFVLVNDYRDADVVSAYFLCTQLKRYICLVCSTEYYAFFLAKQFSFAAQKKTETQFETFTFSM